MGPATCVDPVCPRVESLPGKSLAMPLGAFVF